MTHDGRFMIYGSGHDERGAWKCGCSEQAGRRWLAEHWGIPDMMYADTLAEMRGTLATMFDAVPLPAPDVTMPAKPRRTRRGPYALDAMKLQLIYEPAAGGWRFHSLTGDPLQEDLTEAHETVHAAWIAAVFAWSSGAWPHPERSLA
jgi:hypothetical protein